MVKELNLCFYLTYKAQNGADSKDRKGRYERKSPQNNGCNAKERRRRALQCQRNPRQSPVQSPGIRRGKTSKEIRIKTQSRQGCKCFNICASFHSQLRHNSNTSQAKRVFRMSSPPRLHTYSPRFWGRGIQTSPASRSSVPTPQSGRRSFDSGGSRRRDISG